MKKYENLYVFYDEVGQVYGWSDSKAIAKRFHEERPWLKKKKFRVDDLELSNFGSSNDDKRIADQLVISTAHEFNTLYAKYYGELMDLFGYDSYNGRPSPAIQSLSYIRKTLPLKTILKRIVFQQDESFFLDIEIDYERMVRYFLRNPVETKP